MARPWNSKRLKRTEAFVVALLGVLVLSLLPVACRRAESEAIRPASSADNINSKSLKQTVVVATSDCPLPEHKNAIWCSTFQMAWDRLKQDAVGEPIQVIGAEELASRLNHAEYPISDIEAKSYYAAAGFAKGGIIEEVQREMVKRFPSEPVPTFDSGYRTLPDVVLAYAYLNVDVGFEYPYYDYATAFDFQDSLGVRVGVTAFCAQTRTRGKNYERMRDQVDVLYYDPGHSPDTAQFAVDLSKDTRPYQVVLARMPRCTTFGETAKMLQEKIAESRSNPDYGVLRKLRPIDTLAVPDMLYKLTHHFDELLGKRLSNQKYVGYPIFEAVQKIDFTLSRTGIVLKSEVRLSATRAGGRVEPEKPRHLRFDRPFLICVQKREPNATPFFLMWVDNAELMKPYDSGGKKG